MELQPNSGPIRGCQISVWFYPMTDITAGWKKKQRSGDVKEDQPQILTFLALRPRLIQLLLEALHCETDSFNVQILLAGI